MALGLERTVGWTLEELDQIRQEQRLVGDAGEGREDRLDIAARAADGAGQELQCAPTEIARDGSVNDVRESAVIACGAEERQHRSSPKPPARQRDILVVEIDWQVARTRR